VIDPLVAYALAGLIGAFVGATELIARYRDKPLAAVATIPAAVYVAINAIASATVLAAAEVFGLELSSADDARAQLLQVVVAGLGAMAIFRSAVFTVRVGSTEVGIGPVALLQVLLTATDRGVDRVRAEDRNTRVSQITRDLTFDALAESLPTYALALLQNVSSDDQLLLGKQVSQLRESKMDDRIKVLIIGLTVMNVVGENVLDAACQSIRRELKKES